MTKEPVLKARLQSDLTSAIKQRDGIRSATLRMSLAAITNEEVAGKSARVLSDADVVKVLGKEAKKRREAASAYTDAGRTELAERERAEEAVIGEYLPERLSDDEVAQIVRGAVADTGAAGMAAMGAVMKSVQPKIAGRADGAAVAALVRAELARAGRRN